MEFDQFNELSDGRFDESISFRDVLEKYLIHAKWFVLSIILFGVLAFFKLRYEVPQYKVNATILIKSKEKGNSFADLSDFEDLGLFGSGGDNSLENEMQILKSRSLMTKVVNELKLNIRYFIEESPYNKEQFLKSPITLHIKSDSSTINSIGTNLQILIHSNKKFQFIGFDEIPIGNYEFGKDFNANLGNELRIDNRLVNIELNENFHKDLIGKKMFISVKPVTSLVYNYLEQVIIEPVDERLSKVLTLSLNETEIERGIALINNLIEQYNADGINDKNEIAQATTDFLDLRIELISTELTAIEGTAEQFKSRKGMVDVNAGANIFLQSSSVNESELIAANMQQTMANYMLEELRKNDNTKPLPGNIGLSDLSAVALVGEFNTLVLQRNRILKSSSAINPIIINIDSQLAILKNNLISSLNNLNSSLQIQINALSKQSGRISSRIASIPKNEREFKDIVRQQETKNALYLFLLQKREESILSNAVSVDKAKVIDGAYSNGNKVSPKKMTTYLGSIILGMLIPFLVLYVKDLLDTKVHDENDIKQLKIPFIGDIPLTSSKNDLYISDNDNSNIAEAFRYIRTNINYMLDKKTFGKIIFITSTQSGEGKTFTAINLATSLAISGKKTLLLGMDLRAPKINKYLDLEDILGVTNFIKNKSLNVNSITETHTNFENLHLINSGDIPPNPVELLMSKRVDEIFEEVKNSYEYIIVDTAPVGMVTDTIQISKYADLSIYVIKANFLDKRMLHIPDKLHKENKLPNMSILINGSDHSKGAYGYGYGYGNKKKKPWYKL
ncbi:MAG: polysaccharide biosynthesis tyrosine autokinase [Flavobacteriaceae bacterium]|nr:polysaccharide biosynthesis tyrosine autokinase [Flavobacteriaceae bacterium]